MRYRLFGVMLVFVFIFQSFFMLPVLISGVSSNFWGTVRGEIVAANKQQVQTDGGIGFQANVSYRYAVGNESFENTTIQFGMDGGVYSEADVDSLLEMYRPGASVDIRVDPDSSENSTLMTGVNGNFTFFILISLGTLIAGIALIFAPFLQYWAYRKRNSNVEAFSATKTRNISKVELTPSELVLINGQDFAKKRFRNTTVLLDGKVKVADDLLAVILKVAVLAHWDRGAIRLEVGQWSDDEGKSRNELLAIPTGVLIEWPEDTIESRLVLDRSRPVIDIIKEWFTHTAWNPKVRGMEKVKILMTLRGLAGVIFTPSNGRTYQFAQQPHGIDLQATSKSVQSIIARIESSKPAIAGKLDKVIGKAIKSNTYRGENATEIDPWLDEAEIRTARYREYFGNQVSTLAKPVLKKVGIGSIWMVAILLIYNDFAVVIPGITTLLFVLLYVFIIYDPKLDSDFVLGRIDAFVRQRAVYAVPALFCISTIFLALFERYPIQASIGGLISLFLVLRFALRDKIKARISALVTQPSAEVRNAGNEESKPDDSNIEQSRTSAALSYTLPSLHKAVQTIDRSNHALRVELVEPGDLPEGSQESNSRLRHIVERGNAMHRTYTFFLCCLATAITVVALAAWQFGFGEIGGSRSGFSLSNGMLTTYGEPQYPAGLVYFYVFTLIFIVAARYLVSSVPARMRKLYQYADIKGNAKAYKQMTEAEIIPLKPYVTALLILIWLLLSIDKITDYAMAPAPFHIVFTALSILIPLLFYALFWKARQHLEEQYPIYPPLNLLALRVFGSTDLNDYLLNIHRWHWIGIMQMLEGPDNSGEDLADFFLYISGSIEDAIVDDEAELEDALKKLKTDRDGQLRFSTNSLQCNDATWKKGLSHMLEKSHVVVMDLSGFSQENQGISYEISVLLDRVPLKQFFFLINDCTDIAYLNSLVQDAWTSLHPDSPNLNYTDPALKLFNIGGGTERTAEETNTEWEYRLRSRIDREKLVAMLCDAALSVEQFDNQKGLRAPVENTWARTWCPSFIRKPITVLFLIFCLYTLMTSWFFLSAERAPLDSFQTSSTN